MLVTTTKRKNITPAEQMPTLASMEREVEDESMLFVSFDDVVSLRALGEDFEIGVDD